MPRKPPSDPLADHLAHGRIDMAQFKAGREFQKHFGIADKRQPDSLTNGQDAAWKSLAMCYRQLGADGSALVNTLNSSDDREADCGLARHDRPGRS
jgi:hypothetical protein